MHPRQRKQVGFSALYFIIVLIGMWLFQAPTNSALTGLLGWTIPLLPWAIIWFFMFRRMGQAGASEAGVPFFSISGDDICDIAIRHCLEQDPGL
jgi:F0F1-type ATP synthase assembly protein I